MRTSWPSPKRSYPTSKYTTLAASRTKLTCEQIPLHTLIKITPRAYGCHEERYPLPIEAVDTHRPKPKRGEHSHNLDIPESRAPVSRDYFGNASTAVHADDVTLALENYMDTGMLTPKAETGGGLPADQV